MTSQEITQKLPLGSTRKQMREILGEPDQVQFTTRKHPRPSVYKYDKTELYFRSGKNGPLWMIYEESPDGQTVVFQVGGYVHSE